MKLQESNNLTKNNNIKEWINNINNKFKEERNTNNI